jgi:hypothetical protein
MIHLGYGKFWRSDEIVGLMPIEAGRGPGRRTEIYVATRDEPIVGSRSQRSILTDMSHAAATALQANRIRETLSELIDAFGEIEPGQRLTLASQAGFEVAEWEERLAELVSEQLTEVEDEVQGDLFG